MAAAQQPSPAQFIGSKISLISKSEIRYEGILYALDVTEATISLAKVKSFGTEDRPTERPVAVKDEIYEFIIFRGTDIRVIDVIEPPKTTTSLTTGLSSDPAIVEVSHCHSTGQGGLSALGQAKGALFSNPPPQSVQPQIQIQPQVQPQPRITNVFDGLLGSSRISLGTDASVQASKNQRGNRRGRQQQNQSTQSNQNNMNGQNQNNGGQQRQGGSRQGQQRGNNFNGGQQQNQQQQMRGGGGGRFGGRGGFNQRGGFGRKKGMMPQQQAKMTFEVEYDFEKANEELIEQLEKIKLNDSGTENQEKVNNVCEKPEETEPAPFYQKENFFDNISCEASEIAKGNGHRPDWRAERKLNTETFGNMANRRSGGYQSRSYGRGGGGGGGFYRGYNRGYSQPFGGYGGFNNGFNAYNNYGGYNGRYRGGNRGGMVF